MSAITALIRELDPRNIGVRVAHVHDQAREDFRADTTVRNYAEFIDLTARYVQFHYRRCITPGGEPSRIDAGSIAKAFLKQEYRRQGGGDDVTAFRDCRDGLDGGIRHVLNVLCESMKAEAIENYTRHVFDSYLPPEDPRAQQEMLTDFVRHYSNILPGIDPSAVRPDKLEEMIRAFVRGLRQVSTIFSRR